MPQGFRYVFLLHMIVAGVVGLLLLIVPGRVLPWVNWEDVAPITSRLLGAALVALAWGSFRSLLAGGWREAAFVAEMGAVSSFLACAGLLRHLIQPGRWSLTAWIALAVFAVFGFAFLAMIISGRLTARK
ncbi:MAG: hypothetical protein ACP5OO_10195 [Chloroflexia bacterium]